MNELLKTEIYYRNVANKLYEISRTEGTELMNE